MVFFRRTQSDDDPWLREKTWIFAAGAVVALVGMLSDTAWIVFIGGVILLSGILIRFLPRDERGDESGEAPGKGPGGGAP
jgi:hypothetical protein